MLDFLAGKGTTEIIQDYSFIDKRPLSGHNYYRIKQIDFDGAFEYFDMVSILNDAAIEKLLTVFPNPSSGQFTLSLSNPENRKARIKLFDSTGNLIWEQNFTEQEAIPYWEMKFDLPQREIYFVMTQIEDLVETQKISIIQNK